ncbi:uncharacterized protein EDB91DRAFT_551527 [Suillus paluster]|uniref:uncharacterized protein n=1 Tax=Suillus paluster TaxID=48578 RepID=UPI001B868AC8|nr:uncharacterized protein EDB91DRAFT_551527 [Suillus paluster]KAG1735725.1 hypothetical protein EDB91DRAFT_551527 [Suillus paluster]
MFLSLIVLALLGNACHSFDLPSLRYDRNDPTTAHSLALSHLHHIMSGGSAIHPASKPPDVHKTETERPKGAYPKKDDRAYTQVYLARARIEGIEKWRVAVDTALQAAEEERTRFEETNRKRRRTEEEAWAALEETQEDIEGVMAPDVRVEHTDAVGGTKQKRRSRRHELWKGLRNVFFNIIF